MTFPWPARGWHVRTLGHHASPPRQVTVPAPKRGQTVTCVCHFLLCVHISSRSATIGTIRTSWLDLVHPGATRRGRFVTVCPGLPWFDPGLLTGRWGGGSETPQKSAIKLDRAHDRDALQRVTGWTSYGYAPYNIGKDSVTFTLRRGPSRQVGVLSIYRHSEPAKRLDRGHHRWPALKAGPTQSTQVRQPSRAAY